MEAEPAALTGPPPLLERIVLFCVPPAARETVGGDLYEIYRSPLQYGWQAASSLPFVVASQARRNANLPVLGLQALVLFACFEGFFALTNASHDIRSCAAVMTAASLPLLFIREAYQTQERPSCRRAIMETILLAWMVLPFFPQFLLNLTGVRQTSLIWWPGFALLGSVMGMVPVLCCIRAGLILGIDYHHPPLEEAISAPDLADDYRRFRQKTVWYNQLESVALAFAAAICALLGGKIGIRHNMGGSMVVCGYAAAALYLLLDGSARAMPPTLDFLSLRALYQYELARRHQLRRFLWWLWSAPLFLALYNSLILPGIAAGRSPEVAPGILAVLMLGFFVSALNREGAGPIREKISLLGNLQGYGS